MGTCCVSVRILVIFLPFLLILLRPACRPTKPEEHSVYCSKNYFAAGIEGQGVPHWKRLCALHPPPDLTQHERQQPQCGPELLAHSSTNHFDDPCPPPRMVFGASPKSLQRCKGNSTLPIASVSGGFSINPASALYRDTIRHRSLPVAGRASTTNTTPGEDIVMSSTAANQGSDNLLRSRLYHHLAILAQPVHSSSSFFLSPLPCFSPVVLGSSNISQADVEACRNTTPRAPVLPAQETQDGHSRLHAFESDDQLDSHSIHRTGSVERKKSRTQRVNTVIAAVDRLIPSKVNGAPAQGQRTNHDQNTDLRGAGAQFSDVLDNSDNNSQ
ncbi:hypothetical protein CDEST_03495 [Colletotrichum destructivum]|uniref:Uncharacterized protein n=1 Tax=Colletotrichum destructivum TaxID=34406 RepID=A0AAX4I5K4_9PEZI|nr:hypothetical protein CDEST_03495 [Colletotrichum destructivum]